MENVKIYLSGGMGNLSWEEQSEWRNRFIEEIKGYDCEKKAYFFNPVDYYNFKEVRYRTEKEVMDFDLNALRHSDLIVVNFNDPNSIGTSMELMLGKERNMPIIGINESEYKLHPWLIEATSKMCKNLEESIDYIVEFYLN